LPWVVTRCPSAVYSRSRVFTIPKAGVAVLAILETGKL